ncbi:MAG TPA: hypothetical protein VM077_05830 [Candidatus Limnocylindrales bacterium]|nr:hypothetical protein [Candidatus Limnocylindrales bacterium]
MGKIRVKTIGIEEDEKKEKKEAKARAEAKRIEAAKKQGAAEKEAKETNDSSKSAETTKDKNDVAEGEKKAKKTKKEKFSTKKANPHSTKYITVAKLIDKNKTYKLTEALVILPKLKTAKFDETVELHINTHEKGVSGNLTLPHGTGKKAKIEIADHASDAKHVEELVKKIEGGNIDFDILIATPETMVHLAKVARYLGPRGLMPNPKNGTVSPKPLEAIKKFEGGQINFKTEAKASIIHLSVGKLSFDEKKLNENIKAVLQAVQSKNIKNVTLKSTMSPGIKITI